MVTKYEIVHFVDNATSSATTKCGISLSEVEDTPIADITLDLDECTCPACLSICISELTKRLNDIKKATILSSV